MYLNNIGNDTDALEMCMNVLYELMLQIWIFPIYLNNIRKDMNFSDAQLKKNQSYEYDLKNIFNKVLDYI